MFNAIIQRYRDWQLERAIAHEWDLVLMATGLQLHTAAVRHLDKMKELIGTRSQHQVNRMERKLGLA